MAGGFFDACWGRLKAHLFEAAAGAGWALIGVAYLTVPGIAEASPVGREVHPLDTIWAVFYVVGGPLLLWSLSTTADGMPQKRDVWRIAALMLLAAGLAMQTVAAATYNLEPRVGVYAVYAAACLLRVIVLWRTIRRGGRSC